MLWSCQVNTQLCKVIILISLHHNSLVIAWSFCVGNNTSQMDNGNSIFVVVVVVVVLFSPKWHEMC